MCWDATHSVAEQAERLSSDEKATAEEDSRDTAMTFHCLGYINIWNETLGTDLAAWRLITGVMNPRSKGRGVNRDTQVHSQFWVYWYEVFEILLIELVRSID
jgi:hypothetical protein